MVELSTAKASANSIRDWQEENERAGKDWKIFQMDRDANRFSGRLLRKLTEQPRRARTAL